jgi:hypothetical protein
MKVKRKQTLRLLCSEKSEQGLSPTATVIASMAKATLPDRRHSLCSETLRKCEIRTAVGVSRL